MPNSSENKKPEVRTIQCNLAIREAEPKEGKEKEESRTITGTAIVFNKPFDRKDYAGNTYREIIAPSAATAEFLKTQDIKLNLLHTRDSTIARSNKGKGNMKITVDKNGVNFEFEAPKCDLGDRALELVRAGVYSGCSFEFWPKDYSTKEIDGADGKKTIVVTHTEFESITALTIAMDPAYEQTSVDVRELREKAPEYVERKKSADAALAREREVAAARARQRQRTFNNYNNF